MNIIDSETGEIIIDEGPQTGLVMRSDGFRFTSTGLIVQGQPTFAECERMVCKLRAIAGAVQLWLGDLLNYMEGRWGDDFAQAIEDTGYTTGSLANMKWVAAKVPPSLRNENLPFAHHAAVAPLPPEQQQAWLERAERESLSSRALRSMIRAPEPPKDGTKAKGIIYYEEGRLEIWCNNGCALQQIDAIIEAIGSLVDWG